MQSYFKGHGGRHEHHRPPSGLVPGRLVIGESHSPLTTKARKAAPSYCKVVDVSKHGFALLLNQDLPEGGTIALDVKDEMHVFNVKGKTPDFGKNDLYRYNLESINPVEDIEQLFADTGCLTQAK